MPHRYTYLLIGGGITADSAAYGIRQIDSDGSIGLISAELHPPYERPLLSKGLRQENIFDKIWRGTATQQVSFHLGRRAQYLNLRNSQIMDDWGTVYQFDKLLLATGGTPRRLPCNAEGIIYFRTLADHQHLCRLAKQGGRFAVLGGGFIGSEIAATLAMNGLAVTLIFPDIGIGGRTFPADLAQFLNEYYRQRGVTVLNGEQITAVKKCAERYVLKTANGREIIAEHVVAGLGIQPNTALAESAGLVVDNGIHVDTSLRSSIPTIYAAGDVANFYNSNLDMRLRVEHEDNANIMGEMAGRSMAGDAIAYNYLSFFNSTFFDLGYEAVGTLDACLETVADWQEPYRKGTIYYLKHQRICGVLLWNIQGQIESARNLLSNRHTRIPNALVGCIK